MDDTQLLDCTQAMPCDLDDDEEEDETHSIVAWLEVSGSRHEIFSGRNIIGRDADKCRIVIPSKILSKEHAVVEVRAGTHTLADLGSSNKTRLGKMVLRPHVQYALQGGETIRFGNVAASYTIKQEVCDDSGSETGSESMLPMVEEEDERSSSPILSPRLDCQAKQDDEGRAVEHGIEVPSVSTQDSGTPHAKGALSSASPGISLLQASDSFIQPSDAESSVISATQSPAAKTFTPLSSKDTQNSPQEDYNSDSSTDVEDNGTKEPCLTTMQCETPTHPTSFLAVPETPAQPSPNLTAMKAPLHSSSPDASIQETPTASPLTPKENTACSPKKNSIFETPPSSSSSATMLETPARTQRDDLPRESPDNEDSIFKKPLAASPLRAHRTPMDPSPKSYLASKSKEAAPVQLFSAKVSGLDPDAPTQVFTNDAPSDVDLDAPTQVFTSNVDLDAPTQVFTSEVDPDAPTQVLTHDTSVDLDAPTQVFTSDVDLDAPTQVFTSEAPSDIDLDAPTQVFTRDVDLDAPTQIFTHDNSVDLDAPTQVFASEGPTDIDFDAPTQVFTSDATGDVDPNAPTQVFNDDAASDVDPNAPTQVFNDDAVSDVDPNAPTQVFNDDAVSDVDPNAPTQVFNDDAVSDVDPNAPTQVFNDDAVSDVDPNAPTQVFNDDAGGDVDPNAPTQVFNDDAGGDVDPNVPTQVFNDDAGGDVDPNAPTQVFNDDAGGDVDPNAPTQVFNDDAASDVDPNAPTQVFNDDAVSDTDLDAPTQVFSYKASGNVEEKHDSETHILSSSTIIGSNIGDPPAEDPPSSPTILNDADDPDIATQPYADLCASTPRPSRSIVEAWGRLESTTSQSSNTASLPDLWAGHPHENDAASDASESLFDDEEEVHSHQDGEKEVGVLKDMGNDHKLKLENSNSGKSIGLKESTPSDAAVMSSHKGRGKAAPSQSPQSKDAVEGHLTTHLKTPCKQKGRKHTEPSESESESEENTCSMSLRLFDLPTEAEVREHMTPSQLFSSQDKEESSKHVLEVTPHKERSKVGETENAEQTSLGISSQGSKESKGDTLAVTPYKEKETLQEGMSGDESEENINSTSTRMSAERIKDHGKGQRAMAHPTRRTSTRLGSPRASASQNRRGRAVSHATAASRVSSLSASDCTPILSSMTINPDTSTLSSTSAPSSIHAEAPVQSIVPVPNTRRKERENKSIKETDSCSTSINDSAVLSIPTRKYSKRSINEVDFATTTTTTANNNNNNRRCSHTEDSTSVSITPATFTTTVIPSASVVTDTATTTSVAAPTTSSPTQNRRGKQKTQPKGVTSWSKVNAKDPETESLIVDSAQHQPSTAAASSIPATARRRGRASTKPPVMNPEAESVTVDGAQHQPSTAAAHSIPATTRRKGRASTKQPVVNPEAESVTVDSAQHQPSTAAATDMIGSPATMTRRGRPSTKPLVMDPEAESVAVDSAQHEPSTAVPHSIPATTRRKGRASTKQPVMNPEAESVTVDSAQHQPATAAAANSIPATTRRRGRASTKPVVMNPEAESVTVDSAQHQPSAAAAATDMIGSPATTRRRGRASSKQPVVNPEAESVTVDSAQHQPSTAAATDMTGSPATTRRRGRPSTKPPVMKIKTEPPDEVPDDEPVVMDSRTTIKKEKEEIETLLCDQIAVKVEPEADFSGEGSKHLRRARRKPERFSPDRGDRPPRENLRSKKSLPPPELAGRVLRGSSDNAAKCVLQESSKARGKPQGQQRRSKRGEANTAGQGKGGVSVIIPMESTLKVSVKEEPESSEEEPGGSLASDSSILPETNPPAKKNSRSRASASRSARQAPSRMTKRIKMEVVPKEEIGDDNSDASESSTVQSGAEELRASCSRRRSNQSTSSRGTAKRSNSDASDAGSLASNNSFSSRATRSNKDVELWSPSKRQRQASSKPRVLFTGYHDPGDHKIVTDLGGRVVETPLDCTVLVTTKLRRTCKLLSAIGRGRVIVSPDWLAMSKAAGNFVDPWLFLLKDHDAEEKYGFSLEGTIKSASSFLLFEGLSLHATPSVLPPPCQMRDIIECAGGDYLHVAPKKYEPQIRIISCPEDKRLWSTFKSLGIPILGVEFILTGLLRHELLLDEFVLG